MLSSYNSKQSGAANAFTISITLVEVLVLCLLCALWIPAPFSVAVWISYVCAKYRAHLNVYDSIIIVVGLWATDSVSHPFAIHLFSAAFCIVVLTASQRIFRHERLLPIFFVSVVFAVVASGAVQLVRLNNLAVSGSLTEHFLSYVSIIPLVLMYAAAAFIYVSISDLVYFRGR